MMNYHLDKRNRDDRDKKSKFIIIFIIVISFILLSPFILRGLSNVASYFGAPVWKLESYIDKRISSVRYFFSSKKNLQDQNDLLKIENETLKNKMMDYSVIKNDLTKLQEILGRINKEEYILSTVIKGPRNSIYDSLIINSGEAELVQINQKVFVDGVVLIGYIEEVYNHSAKVKLYSAQGEELDVVFGDSYIPGILVGRGGGNFEMTIPRDIEIKEGSPIYLPEFQNQIVAIAGKILFDPRDPFQKVLLTSPVNNNQVSWVQILKIK